MRDCLAALAVLLPLGPLAAQGVAYEGGLSLATGKYIFAARTTGWTLFTGASLKAGRFVLRAGVPAYLENTSLVTGSGAGMMPTGGATSSGMVSDSGRTMMGGGMGGRHLPVPASALTGYRAAAGDPVLHVEWEAVATSRTVISFGGAAKIPATDTSAYGTGQWDVGASLSVTRHVASRWFFSLDLAYWHLGDLPQLDFADPFMATATASALWGRWGASFFVTGSTEALRGYDPPLAIGLGLTRSHDATAWGVSAALGLTQTAPDLSIGVNWRLGR